MRYLLLPALAALLVTACAPRYSPQANKPDAALSCAEIRGELARAREARAEAQSQKGLSAQNVAWFVVFWPGIIGNEYNNTLVIQKADERAAQLNTLYSKKGCR